jgi:TonB family protein
MTSQCFRGIARTGMAALIAAVGFDSAGPVQAAATEQIELPPYKGTLRDDYYPEDARRHFTQGRALVEFALNARGVPDDVVIVNAEPPHEFEDSARRLVKNLRFEVPAGWEQSAAAHRFRIGVRFQVVECPNLSRCESQARNPPADYEVANRTYVVSAQRRVLAFGQPEAPPAPAPARGGSVTSPAPRPGAPSEPIYPPG